MFDIALLLIGQDFSPEYFIPAIIFSKQQLQANRRFHVHDARTFREAKELFVCNLDHRLEELVRLN